MLCLPAEASLLIFTGSLRPWHGIDIAITALAQLPDQVRLVIAGDGDLRSDLTRHAHLLGVGHRMHWLGRLPHERIPVLLSAGDIALAPYPAVPGFAFSPLKLYEYLAAGIPIIASDLGQITELLEKGRWGRLVKPGDADALASDIEAALRDPDGSRRQAQQARQLSLAEHSWTNRAQHILDEVATLATRHHRPLEQRRAVAP
jgi:glycosyltransferase involved in cell wall biosynthesis